MKAPKTPNHVSTSEHGKVPLGVIAGVAVAALAGAGIASITTANSKPKPVVNATKGHLNESAFLAGIQRDGADEPKQVKVFNKGTIFYTEPNPDSPIAGKVGKAQEIVQTAITATDPVTGDHLVGFKPFPAVTEGPTVADEYVWIDETKNPAESTSPVDGGGLAHITLDGVGIATSPDVQDVAVGLEQPLGGGKVVRQPK